VSESSARAAFRRDIGRIEATQRAAELLEKRGVIEVWKETNMYRLKPSQK
jgi:hypothetical protein